MKVLILASSFSGLCQRVLRELVLLGHDIDQHYGMDEPVLREQIASFQPDLILCPFLTHRIPEDIWQQYKCLIVHPGIEGDRGPSSIDYAITHDDSRWGVTLLQADSEMDAGDIWGTQNFPLRRAGKTSTYKREVSTTAVALIKQALLDFKDPNYQPKPLNYNNPGVEGTCNPLLRQPLRRIDWSVDTTRTIMQKIYAADTTPGVLDHFLGHDVHLFGPELEPNLKGEAKQILAIRHGAVCIATIDGAVWIKQMKCKTHSALPAIKLPAARVINALAGNQSLNLATEYDASVIDDIRVEHIGDVAYVYFDFYNGAANTQQCLRLKQRLAHVKASDAKVIVLMGGEDFFSNGIHLNCIEAAADPALESWQNINAIDDVVAEIIHTPNQLTIAALRNNAGAGGAILALACDKVIIREGVVLNPHYAKMGLYGSEYWTYLLPKRIGHELAQKWTTECEPLLASEALQYRFADQMLPEDWEQYHEHLRSFCQQQASQLDLTAELEQKRQRRAADEALKPLENYRSEELAKMREIFYNPESSYHLERKLFVFKGKLPEADSVKDAQLELAAQ
ncbi:hydrogenase maturation protein [Marinagarivorans algicola]|uniref:hydrogenase maturation protein n=1 Tax=Marinagarivorans algicola TaxID=1513270 RepID=UPI0009E8ED0D|nr:hydrogenase maturation protein [Marinagarivorans algicola]